MVPIAPSSTRMRSAANRRSAASALDMARLLRTYTALLLRRRLRVLVDNLVRPQAKQVADRVNEIGTVHCIEMKFGDSVINEVDDLLGRDRGGDQLAGRRIVIEPLEPFREPVRDRRAGARGEIFRLLEVLHRQNAGDDRNMDCVSARLAPASTLALSISMSACIDGLSGCFSG